ncbi:MAG: hypothetical protein IIX64_01885, partial [Bacteroidales bacterium]|nr:hypothetical protein [Bacteroidales bacterium]
QKTDESIPYKTKKKSQCANFQQFTFFYKRIKIEFKSSYVVGVNLNQEMAPLQIQSLLVTFFGDYFISRILDLTHWQSIS